VGRLVGCGCDGLTRRALLLAATTPNAATTPHAATTTHAATTKPSSLQQWQKRGNHIFPRTKIYRPIQPTYGLTVITNTHIALLFSLRVVHLPSPLHRLLLGCWLLLPWLCRRLRHFSIHLLLLLLLLLLLYFVTLTLTLLTRERSDRPPAPSLAWSVAPAPLIPASAERPPPPLPQQQRLRRPSAWAAPRRRLQVLAGLQWWCGLRWTLLVRRPSLR